MILGSRIPPKLNPRADFKPEQFRKVIISHGMDIRWEQAAECPCSQTTGAHGFSLTGASGDAEQARVDCPACHGKGYLYHSAQTIRAVVTGARKEEQRHGPAGATEYGRGQIGITLLPEHLPTYGDRLTIMDSAMIYRETLKRGSGATDTPRYPISPRSHDLEGGQVSFGVRHLIPANAQGIVDPAGALEEGSDFTVDGEGAIEWINPPNEGDRFSVTYYAHPTYIITNHPHAVRDTYVNVKAPAPYHAELPVYAEAQLEFYGTPEGTAQ